MLINSCVNCTIFVAAVSKVCTIEKCEHTTLIVAANNLRIGNCIDSQIHCYTPEQPPVVYGDTRNLRMAPHNAMYSHFQEHLSRASINFMKKGESAKWFEEAINFFRKPVIMGKSVQSAYGSQSKFSVQQPVDFNKLVLPWNILQRESEDLKGGQSIVHSQGDLLCP